MKDNSKYQKEYYLKYRNRINERSKEYNSKRRIIVLKFYGGEIPSCKCCGEKEIKFLSIDHTNGGGNKHRKEIGLKDGKGGNICHWIIKNNFPDGFQVLCHNCNMAKGFYGKCPHKK
jgi:uroporphyrinogen-III decarboxylase